MTWQPIETAPRDGTKILLLVNGVVHQGARHLYDGKDVRSGTTRHNWMSETLCFPLHDADVTHWKPLSPPPPESEG
jgi:hypothetical protein